MQRKLDKQAKIKSSYSILLCVYIILSMEQLGRGRRVRTARRRQRGNPDTNGAQFKYTTSQEINEMAHSTITSLYHRRHFKA